MNEQHIIKQFTEQLKMQFDIVRITIYRDSEKVYGDLIDPIEMERYLALTCTAIFKDPHQSRMVTHIRAGTCLYLVLLESRNTTAFDGLDRTYIIEEFKKLKRKLGDTA